VSAREAFVAAAAAPALPLPRQVEAHALRRPDALAVVYGEWRLGYRDLNGAANRLAHALVGRGVQPGQCVPVLLDRGPDLLVALLAVLKAGAAWVPLDPVQPDARLGALVGLVAPPLVVTRAALRVRLPPGVAVFDLDREVATVAAAPSTDMALPLPATAPAYLVFTSGSAGRPKPVVVTHGNVAGLFAGITAGLGLDDRDTWSWFHSPAFGFSIWETWGALLHGACLAVVPEATRRDPAALADFLVEEGVTVFSQTPSAFRRLLDAPDFAARLAKGRVRCVALSGEPVRDDDVQRWFAQVPRGPELVNTYAITETAGQLTLRRFGPASAAAPDAANVGAPLPGRRLRVVGAAGDALPASTPGEVWVAGDCVADYLDPADGRGRFAALAGEPGRWYRTGDRGELCADGTLRLLGRADSQIKFRGARLEPAEVEAALRRQPGVRDAAVVLRADGRGPPRLTAYVVPEAAQSTGAPSTGAAFWPSLGAHGLYDEFLYGLMNVEPRRLEAMRRALAAVAPGRVVLDLGTGRDALFARLAVEAGAAHVYAVEVLEAAARDARELVGRLGLAGRITVLAGDIADLSLPVPVDACCQGIVGNIGSADGVVSAWRAAARHFVPGCVPLPARCTTRIAPASLPVSLRAAPRYDAAALRYARQLQGSDGRTDLRLCVRGLGAGDLLAGAATFEVLDFRQDLPDTHAGEACFVITRDGLLDGLLLWAELEVMQGDVVDYLAEQQGWLPVFLPLPGAALPVTRGQRLTVRWRCVYESDPRFPDYVVEVDAPDGVLRLVSRHGRDDAGTTALHRALAATLAAGEGPSVSDLRAGLSLLLPDTSLPQAWVFVPALPLNTNGKLDRAALPSPGSSRPRLATPWVQPATPQEQALATLWEEVLGIDGVGRDDDFFDLGGDSILAVQLVTAVARRLGCLVPLAALFDGPTIAAMAPRLGAADAAAGARDQGEL
jgi:amino acid adenylation domain-containing protein